MLVQKLDQPTRRVVHIDRAGELTHAVDPVVERNNIGAWDIERIGQNKDHLVPRLPHRVFDVVDGVRRDVGEEQLT